MTTSRSRRSFRFVPRYFFCAAWVAVFVFAGFNAGVNATTEALSLLLAVLGVATKWGLAEAALTSVLAVLGFNYYFLPPIRTFTIADPQNWIALFAFLITAITVSQLSTKARRETEETRASRNELSRLYELSRALLMRESGDAVRQSVLAVSQILGGTNVAFFDRRSNLTYGFAGDSSVSEPDLARVAETGDAVISGDFRVVPVRLGSHIVGSLAIEAAGLSSAMCDSVANLIAINYERALAIDRAAAAEIARRNEQFKSSLLDGLAHDLKTPLTAIRTCVTRLIDFPPRTEEIRGELLAIIDQESARLQSSITEAIELARIESSALHLDREPVLASEVIEAAIADNKDENVARYLCTGPDDPRIDGDRELLRRALLQILENARKYSPPDSPIEIASRAEDSRVLVSVADRGPGFDPGELGRVFEKFYRGVSSRSREGTGMGLAIAKGIIEAHGGSISAANRPGGGAVVSFSIPQALIQ